MERGAPSLTRWGTGGQKIKQGFEFLRQQNLAPPQGATKPLLFFAPAFPVGAAFKLEYLILNPNPPDLPIPLHRHSFRREGTETLVPQVEIH
jgi:hypothetical protein